MPSFYETDIAPYASRFFSQVSADPRLSDAQRTRLQGTLLNGMQDITETRMKLQQEREQGKMRQLQYQTGVEALEEARWKRSRMLQQEQKLGGLKEQAIGVLTADADPDTKRQALGAIAVANMDTLEENPGARSILGFAADALPKPKTSELTATTMARYAGKVDPEILATGDPVLIGRAFEEAKKDEDAAEEAKKLNESQKRELAKMPLKYAKWTNPETGTEEEDRWLDPASTERATMIVRSLGTPEEVKRFDELKKADSDRERELLVTRIQLRHLAGADKKPGVRERMGLR